MDKKTISAYRQKLSDGLFGVVLPFWEKYGADPVNGGVRTCLDREGKVFSAEKGVWMQGRGGWLFSHVYNDFGHDKRWLDMAENCVKFAKKHCIDPADGRMYFIVSDEGAPFRKRRYTYSEFFYIMACAEYYRATGDEEYLQEARKYYRMVLDIHDDPSKDPYKITPKFLPAAPAMRGLCDASVLTLVSRTLRQADPAHASEYIANEKRFIADICAYHFNEEYGALMECVGLNGEYIGHVSGGRITNPGHCMEAAWGLLREAEELDMPELIPFVEKVYEGAMRHGWDKEFGGLLYFVDVEGYPPQAYEHDMKLWWVHTEALIAAIKLYRVTGKERYFEDFKRLMEYCFAHFNDEEYGEWYGYLRRDGAPTEPRAKGNVFKGPFHVPRMYCEVIRELEKLERM